MLRRFLSRRDERRHHLPILRKTLMIEGLFQPIHLLVIPGIVLLVFGPRKLPELGKGLGDGIRGFKAAMNGEEKPAENAKTERANKAA